ncbi:two component transcriptional regulator, LuxR family [Paenibacillus algorifonticola]|uniref:Two component transcriptional regulator, LuxR family n=1 Tax=Paenibacillus algorifonticola TaxID=684063 RepID=A0A1I1Z3H0_9BACL|nr:response regulator transcription factor [Paenibacillus algorifonticola]SFE26366.1 two component transcriptional regulator, LuxR family [Paenibacillus algorifonticola]
MSHIRVLLVEDDPDWVKAMTLFLNKEADLLVVGAASTAEEALSLARTLSFDVALLDIQLADHQQNGIYTAVEMHRIHAAKIIMLTSMSEEEVMTQAFTAGAINYIEKTNFRQLPEAIRSAYHHPAPMEALLKEFARLKREEQLKDLTSAEREVFELIEQGYTQTQIEQKLYKAESTLKNQVNKMLKKLGVRSRKEAIEKVRRKGLTAGIEENKQ